MTFALLFALATSLAQEPAAKTENPCYKDKGIDEYIAELQKLQKKKGTHNPLPNNVCIFGWCKNAGAGPAETKPKSGPKAEEAEERPQADTRASRPVDDVESSSKKEDLGIATTPAAEISTYDPIGAARDADVGDYYFHENNYRGALMRYSDALKEKPGDAGVHLRLARGWEKLGAAERAYLEYDAVVKLEREGKSASEAKDGMARLRPVLQKAGVDPVTLTAESQPEQPPCLAAPQGSR
ncbi:MAG: hypothetical protein HYX28_03005 [Candidatus Koribacter versatilis]|uniref:Tetratricopeptide repeat protein n=1 Tax=Candidatus Korobacter versatilis TaxID=658062 RepID=A0A932ENW5_9BACT|nr:hypothetical protein [Candidatus Koribacter versatilis]